MLKDGRLSVSKPDMAFTGIGADHGIEQENRALNVFGAIKGHWNQALGE